MFWGTGKYKRQYSMIFVLTLVACISESLALDYKAYDIEELEKIGVLGLVIITIIVPSKYRVVIIGTILGLSLSYFTYKYVLPLLLTLL